MNLKLRNLLVLVCFCMFGIQSGLSFVAEYRDMMSKCTQDGGYCINSLLPTPPRRRVPRKRMGARRRPGTRTRKGRRPKPSPRALGAQNTVLPGGRKAAPPPAVQQQGVPARAPYPAQQPPVTPGYNDPFAGLFNFGTGTGGQGGQGGGFDPFFGMMMLKRKKRQAAAPVEPFEPGEAPVRMPGQTVFAFLNQHCLKSEPSIQCQKTGGFCCIPHP